MTEMLTLVLTPLHKHSLKGRKQVQRIKLREVLKKMVECEVVRFSHIIALKICLFEVLGMPWSVFSSRHQNSFKYK